MAILSCSVTDCERKSVSRGWCDRHYRRWKRHGDPMVVNPGNGQRGGKVVVPAPEGQQCSIEGCVAEKKIRGWCVRHYKRWNRGYDPATGQVRDDSRLCAVEGCTETIRISEYCYSHYARIRRHGDPVAGRKIAKSATDHADETRTCNTCEERKDLNEYHRGNLYILGRSPKCRACCALERREWSEANKELIDERSKGYRHKRRALLAGAGYEHGLTRAKIRTWHGDRCAYCRVEMNFNVRGLAFVPEKATIDHIVPISRGGGHVVENVTLCCSACNSSKGDRTKEEFLEKLGIADMLSTEGPNEMALSPISALSVA